MDAGEPRRRLSRRFRGQAASCAALGSPLYADLLGRAADDLDRGGPTWRLLEPFAGLPGGALVALRYLGATHRQALAGGAPALARHYPSCGGDGDHDAAWSALRALTDEAAASRGLDPWLSTGVQTNEVGRSAVLLGGFLEVARATRRPLRLLELGASAGLNLRWDRYRYRGWGPAESAVDLGDPWVGAERPLLTPATVEVVERAGCDLAPVDPATGDGRLTLLSFVWPDMGRRFALLDAACRVAATTPAGVATASADVWAAEQLAAAAPGRATVVFHSVVLHYVEASARQRLVETIAAAGGRAGPSAPVAWLRFEPAGPLGPDEFELRLTTWPGGRDRGLATAHPHGTWIRWTG